jgi:hypothetical protein
MKTIDEKIKNIVNKYTPPLADYKKYNQRRKSNSKEVLPP